MTEDNEQTVFCFLPSDARLRGKDLTPDTRHLKPFQEANRFVDIVCRLRYKRTFATEDLLLAARMVFMKGIENE